VPGQDVLNLADAGGPVYSHDRLRGALFLRLARYILCLAVAAQIAAAHAQDATPLPPAAAQPFTEGQTGIANCLEPLEALRTDVRAKGELVRASSQGEMVPGGRCSLIMDYEIAQMVLMEFVRRNADKCGIRRDYIGALEVTYRATKRHENRACPLRVSSEGQS
jgi:hypothetical protein